MKYLLIFMAAGCLALGTTVTQEPARAEPPSPTPRFIHPRSFDFVQTPFKRPGGARLKTSLNAYSFNKTLND
jgi:hypothetical protein